MMSRLAQAIRDRGIRLAIPVLACLAVALPYWACAGDAPAVWENVRVVLTDGTVHNGTTVAWGLDGYILRLETGDGQSVSVGPLSVEAVYDESGRDISSEIEAASPRRDVHFALLGADRTVPFVFRVLPGVGGALAGVRGEGDFHVVGAMHAGARVRLAERLHAHVQYRRQHVKVDSGGVSTVTGLDADELHLLAGWRVRDPRDNNNFGFLEFGVSWVRYPARDFTGTGVTVQGGVVLPLAGRVGLDLGAVLQGRPRLNAEGSDPAVLLGLNLGLVYRP